MTNPTDGEASDVAAVDPGPTAPAASSPAGAPPAPGTHPLVSRCLSGVQAALEGLLLVRSLGWPRLLLCALPVVAIVVLAQAAALVGVSFFKVRYLGSLLSAQPGPLAKLVLPVLASPWGIGLLIQAGFALPLLLAVPVNLMLAEHAEAAPEDRSWQVLPPSAAVLLPALGRALLRMIGAGILAALVHALPLRPFSEPLILVGSAMFWADQLLDPALVRRGLDTRARWRFLRQRWPECAGLMLVSLPLLGLRALDAGVMFIPVLTMGACLLARRLLGTLPAGSASRQR